MKISKEFFSEKIKGVEDAYKKDDDKIKPKIVSDDSVLEKIEKYISGKVKWHKKNGIEELNKLMVSMPKGGKIVSLREQKAKAAVDMIETWALYLLDYLTEYRQQIVFMKQWKKWAKDQPFMPEVIEAGPDLMLKKVIDLRNEPKIEKVEPIIPPTIINQVIDNSALESQMTAM